MIVAQQEEIIIRMHVFCRSKVGTETLPVGVTYDGIQALRYFFIYLSNNLFRGIGQMDNEANFNVIVAKEFRQRRR